MEQLATLVRFAEQAMQQQRANQQQQPPPPMHQQQPSPTHQQQPPPPMQQQQQPSPMQPQQQFPSPDQFAGGGQYAGPAHFVSTNGGHFPSTGGFGEPFQPDNMDVPYNQMGEATHGQEANYMDLTDQQAEEYNSGTVRENPIDVEDSSRRGRVGRPPRVKMSARKAVKGKEPVTEGDAANKVKQPNFLAHEDRLLASSWLQISCDPMTNTGKTKEAFWTKVTNLYNSRRGVYPERSLRSLQCRLDVIQGLTHKFAGYYASAVRANPSGMSDADKVSLRLYNCLLISFHADMSTCI